MTITRTHLAGLELALSLMIKQRLSSGGVHLNALASLEAAVEQAQAAPEAEPDISREERMVVIDRAVDGTPTIWCDPEISDIVSALNAGEVRTVASCSGHGYRPGVIALVDGRELLIAKDYAEARRVERHFPGINGEPPLAHAGGIAPEAEPVAWANWKVGTKSYVPYRSIEEAERCVRGSELAATQLGPYKVVPLYTAPQHDAELATLSAKSEGGK